MSPVHGEDWVNAQSHSRCSEFRPRVGRKMMAVSPKYPKAEYVYSPLLLILR